MSKIRNIAVAVGAVLSLGAASQAAAAPLFQVNPNAIPGTVAGSVFEADFISGISSALVEKTGGTTYSSTGWVQFNGFSNNGTVIQGNVHRATFDYNLYALFTQTFTCPGALGVGVSCAITSANFDVYADPGADSLFTNATLAATASVSDVDGDDFLLANANTVYSGSAGLNAQGGAFQNVNTNFALTAAGGFYFIDPNPFYDLAFSTFNNTSQGIVCDTGPLCVNPNRVAITQEVGATDFNRVPEPASIALIGLALAGLGASRRRK